MSENFKKWYIVQTFSGLEKRALKSLNEHIKIKNLEDLFGEIIIPVEEIVEIRKGQRYKSERKFFPGYILIQMIMNEISWYLVRHTPYIMKFIGGTSENPSSINDKEIDVIINRLKKLGNKPRPKTLFEPGEIVRINDGPFIDFNGVVENIDYEKNRLRLSVSIFGRSTSVELGFKQVEKN